MATSETAASGGRASSRWLWRVLLLVLVAAVLAGAFIWNRMRDDARARAAAAAQVGCLCRYVSGRTMDACAADPAVVRKWVSINEDAASRAVIASVPTLAEQVARWSPQAGCMLDPWQD